jgi:hypothetical protein
MMIYNGYECYRNRLTGKFYALPIVADSAVDLKAAIDRVAAKQRPNPWELPYAGEAAIAA